MDTQNEKNSIEKDENMLFRKLKNRHLNLIAIGGAIGTGLFFASGNAISDAGPGGALVAYIVMGTMVYFLMTSLGEMATQVPLSGSFQTYSNKFVDPAFGFTVGWCYYLGWALTITFEVVVGVKVLQYWLPNMPIFIPSLLLIALLFVLNVFTVNVFGEAEFWFAGIKVIAIITFLVVGFLMIFGLIGNHTDGLSNFTYTDPETGASAPFPGGIIAILSTFLIAGFSFQGTEVVGLTAGESENPDKHIPKAINSVFWRILLFYIGGIFVIATLVPFTDEHLLSYGAEEIAYSPFTLIFYNAGMSFAADFMNFIILTSVLSCGNSGLYSSARLLYAMSNEGRAPKIFSKTNTHGVPMPALFLTLGIAVGGFLASLIPGIDLFGFLINTVGLSGFFAWLSISICHYRFRRAWLKQGHTIDELKFKAKFFPFGAIAGMVLCSIVIFGSNIWIWQWGFNWFDFISNYFMLPLFLAVFIGYKVKNKTKLVPLEEMDFSAEYVDYSKMYKKDVDEVR